MNLRSRGNLRDRGRHSKNLNIKDQQSMGPPENARYQKKGTIKLSNAVTSLPAQVKNEKTSTVISETEHISDPIDPVSLA
jgi:hypothetical protein